eukprot:TRINITY_DN5152_c0_g2_i1.p1 TRINITY_DN5152_c0_g2~~TRINITY_DN5152_c0_g2_i1.p1  ORF type:complete len:598 (+),score=150.62 TRINITY_DN5152_c0_g2_i1:405-2198(+)
MNGAFNGQILVEKLSKLNNSQQSIETLSHWCIFHRKNAKQVVDTWDRQFHCAPREQRISFLYLANDILQNSRRKGSEFVGEFWKVLPGALRDVFDKGDEHGRRVAMRLVDIWEERKVFGSRGQILKEQLVGQRSQISFNTTVNGQNSPSIRAKSIAGGTLEKIISAFEAVHNHYPEEDAAIGKCKVAVNHVENVERAFQNASNIGTVQDSGVVEELRENGIIIRQCIDQLEASETARMALVSVLRETLNEEESKLEFVRSQLQVAHHQSEQASNMCQHVLNDNRTNIPSPMLPATETYNKSSVNLHDSLTQGNGNQAIPASTVQSMPFYLDSASQVDEDHKKTAAAVAAKLAASTSSAQMLSYVLSSLASEGTAMTSGLRTSSAPVEISADYHLDKRQNAEHMIPSAEENAPFMVHTPTCPPSNSPRLKETPLPHQVSSVQHQGSPIFQQQSFSIQHQTSSSNFQPQSVSNQTSPSKLHHQMSPTGMPPHGSSPLNNEDTFPLSHQMSPMHPHPPPPPPPHSQYIQGVGNVTGNPYIYGGSAPLQQPPQLQGYPMVGIPLQGMAPYSGAANPYPLFQSSEMQVYNQPPLPTTPISRQ